MVYWNDGHRREIWEGHARMDKNGVCPHFSFSSFSREIFRLDMTRIDFVRRFRKLEAKNEDYFLFNGFIGCLKPEEVCEVIDLSFNQDIYKRRLIIKRLTVDLQNNIIQKHLDLFNSLLNIIDSLASYHQKERCSTFLYEMSFFMPLDRQKKLIAYFLNSKYLNNRKRAYAFLSLNWNNEFKQFLVNAWERHEDLYDESLELLLMKLSPEYLYQYDEIFSQLFDDEDIEYDFRLKILRNKYFIKTHKYQHSRINELKDSDPISYIFIRKELNQKIDDDYACKIYKLYSNSQRYLAVWFSQLNMWQALENLSKNLK